jgi:hypothetical protein
MIRGSARVLTVVVTVPTVHEKVNQRAKQEQRPRKHAEEVRSVLLPEEENGDRQKHTERHGKWNVKSLMLAGVRLNALHRGSLLNGKAFDPPKGGTLTQPTDFRGHKSRWHPEPRSFRWTELPDLSHVVPQTGRPGCGISMGQA